MLAMGLGLAMAAWSLAAPANTLDRQRDKAAEKTEGKELIERSSMSWLKVYPLPLFRESWRLEGTVKNLGQDLPRVREVFSKVGAALAGSEESPGKGRLSYRCPKESAQRALIELNKIGAFSEPTVRPQMVAPVTLAEIQSKVKALEADKSGHGQELAKMPAISDLVDEMLGHLRGVEAALKKPEVEVLVHLTVKEKS